MRFKFSGTVAWLVVLSPYSTVCLGFEPQVGQSRKVVYLFGIFPTVQKLVSSFIRNINR